MQEIIPFIDFSAKKQNQRLRNIYSQNSVFIFFDVKSTMLEKIIAKDTKQGKTSVKVNRMKASKFVQSGKCDVTGEFTLFGQIFTHFKQEGYSVFKV